MKNKILILIGLIVPIAVISQVSVPNNIPSNGAFLGWNAGGAGGDLDFRTNNLTHMRMMQNGISTINGSVIDRSGFVALSQNPAVFGLPGASAFSLLHLNGDNGVGGGPQQLGYRSWMRHGIVFTHITDLMYIGPKQTGNLDVTDA